MTRRLLHASVIALGVLLSSCQCGTHVRPPADAALDVPDAGPFTCGTPDEPYFGEVVCTPERDAECQRHAQALTPTGTALSRCLASTFSRLASCTAGLVNCNDRLGSCLCAPGAGSCVSNEVCVSDPPGSPPRCAVICTQEEPAP